MSRRSDPHGAPLPSYATQFPQHGDMVDGANSNNVDSIRRELQLIGEEMAKADELRDRRGEIVDQARDAKLTLREIAQLLGMTETGVRKAQQDFHRRRQQDQWIAS